MDIYLHWYLLFSTSVFICFIIEDRIDTGSITLRDIFRIMLVSYIPGINIITGIYVVLELLEIMYDTIATFLKNRLVFINKVLDKRLF